jgi:hypothetical protein
MYDSPRIIIVFECVTKSIILLYISFIALCYPMLSSIMPASGRSISNCPPDYAQSIATSTMSESSIVTPQTTVTSDTSFAEDRLPTYSTGASIKKSVSGRTPSLSISLDDARDYSFFNSGEVVSGTVTVHPYQDLALEEVRIDLRMVESVIRSKDFPDARMTRTAVVTKYQIPFSAYPQDLILRTGMDYTFAFSMQIPIERPEATCKNGLHSLLPPSVGAMPNSPKEYDDLDVSDQSCRVYYCVCSRLFAGDKKTEQFAYVRVMPSYPLSDLYSQEEYRASKEIKSGMLRRTTLGSCCLTISRVPRVRVWNGTSSIFDLHLRFRTSEATKPPVIKSIIVRAHLITTSSFLGREIDDGQNAPPVHKVVDTVCVQKLDISANSQWELMGANQHAMTVKVPVTLQGLQFVSTFKSCLSERRYEFQFTVQFERASELDLRIPVELVYARETNTITTPLEETFDDPPDYVLDSEKS